MGTCNEFQTINMIEISCNLIAEKPTGTTRGNGPRFNIFGIAPDQIAESAFMGDLLSTSYDTNLVDRSNLGTQATMNTEDLAIDDGREDEEIENLAAGLPDRCVAVLLLTLLVETIYLSNLTGLMIAPNKGDLIRIPMLCELQIKLYE
jgi:hypothetical protein